MNNEEKILTLLERMDQRLDKLEAGQAKLEADVSELKAGQVKIQEDVSEIKTDVKYIWEEIDRFSDRISAQDRIIEKKIM